MKSRGHILKELNEQAELELKAIIEYNKTHLVGRGRIADSTSKSRMKSEDSKLKRIGGGFIIGQTSK